MRKVQLASLVFLHTLLGLQSIFSVDHAQNVYDGQYYNIKHKSGLNLDANGQKVYFTPSANSSGNPYQQWSIVLAQ